MKATNGGSSHPPDFAFCHSRSEGFNSKAARSIGRTEVQLLGNFRQFHSSQTPVSFRPDTVGASGSVFFASPVTQHPAPPSSFQVSGLFLGKEKIVSSFSLLIQDKLNTDTSLQSCFCSPSRRGVSAIRVKPVSTTVKASSEPSPRPQI